ncbi:MAG TPA: hypothetical protein VFR13_05400 [Jiangellaceae bacterium]|nr:hypothetical protein [Jiangellaceae bacterium]
MRSSHRWRWRWGIPVLVAAVALIGVGAASAGSTTQPLRADGIIRGDDGGVADVPVGSGRSYVAGSSVLSRGDDPLPPVQAALVDADRAWLAAGRVPGTGTAHGAMAERALLDLHLMIRPNGALIAANRYHWRYVWPRDASFAVVALSATGHHADAERILRYLADVAPDSGIWHARYLPDGSGAPPDARLRQLDGSGWVPWAVWIWLETHPDRAHAAQVAGHLGEMVTDSADALARSLGDDDLPLRTPDYWEQNGPLLTLGIAAPARLGLRAATALAPTLGVDDSAWRDAGRRLDGAIEREFGARGFPRTVADDDPETIGAHGYPVPRERTGRDAAVTFLGLPFAAGDADIREAVRGAGRSLRVPNGGLRPGMTWQTDVDVAWTPTTALFALALAANGDTADAESLLSWLDEHRTPLGALPEKVNESGEPASVAPLSWTGSLVLLALLELEDDLPLLPAP